MVFSVVTLPLIQKHCIIIITFFIAKFILEVPYEALISYPVDRSVSFLQIGVSFHPTEEIGFQQIVTDDETKYSKEPLHTQVTTTVPKG